MVGRKTNSNAWYADLSEEQQRTCFEAMRSYGYEKARLVIAEQFKVSPSLGAMSAAYQKWSAKEQEANLLRAAVDIENIEEMTQELGPVDDLLRQRLNHAALGALVGGDPDQIKLFMSLALDAGFAKSKYELKIRDQELKARSLELAETKWQTQTCEKFLEWMADKRAVEVAESGASRAEKIETLRQMYFADVDAAEKAGEVELPE